MVPKRWNVPEPIAAIEVCATDGATIIVRRHGNPDGPRLILSHGNGFSIDAYYPFWSLLADRFDLFIHDIRNHGWNPVGDRHAHNFPTFVSDIGSILRDIDRLFGKKLNIGVYHSLSALTALHQAGDEDGFSALVLFDLPIFPPGGFPHHLQGVGRKLGAIARRRPEQYKTPEEFVRDLAGRKVFERMSPGALDLFARATLRRTNDGAAWELCCPREYEAQINEYFFCWAMMADLNSISCPMKAIGADPTVPHSYMPSTDMTELWSVDYDFVPESTHLLQLEEPETCVALALEFIENQVLK